MSSEPYRIDCNADQVRGVTRRNCVKALGTILVSGALAGCSGNSSSGESTSSGNTNPTETTSATTGPSTGNNDTPTETEKQESSEPIPTEELPDAIQQEMGWIRDEQASMITEERRADNPLEYQVLDPEMIENQLYDAGTDESGEQRYVFESEVYTTGHTPIANFQEYENASWETPLADVAEGVMPKLIIPVLIKAEDELLPVLEGSGFIVNGAERGQMSLSLTGDEMREARDDYGDYGGMIEIMPEERAEKAQDHEMTLESVERGIEPDPVPLDELPKKAREIRKETLDSMRTQLEEGYMPRVMDNSDISEPPVLLDTLDLQFIEVGGTTDYQVEITLDQQLEEGGGENYGEGFHSGDVLGSVFPYLMYEAEDNRDELSEEMGQLDMRYYLESPTKYHDIVRTEYEATAIVDNNEKRGPAYPELYELVAPYSSKG
jgi:hypothetical protein